MYLLMGDVDNDQAVEVVCVFDIIPDEFAEAAYNFRNMNELFKAGVPPNKKNRVSQVEYLKTRPYPKCLRQKLWL